MIEEGKIKVTGHMGTELSIDGVRVVELHQSIRISIEKLMELLVSIEKRAVFT